MIGRALAILGGLAGAGTLSQYPEFAQQYTQRLAGQIQALDTVVADFDASAERSGLTREGALEEMTGSAFLADRGDDLRRTITRYEGLQADYALLSSATAVEKILMPHRLADGATFRGTWEDYEPALPLTTAGAVSSGVGFFGGWFAVGGLLWLLVAPVRWLRRARPEPAMSAVPEPEPVEPMPAPRPKPLRGPRDFDPPEAVKPPEEPRPQSPQRTDPPPLQRPK